MVEGPHKLVQREDERLEVSVIGPHHTVAVHLLVPRLRLAIDGADVGVVFDAVVVLGPAAHVSVVLAFVVDKACSGGHDTGWHHGAHGNEAGHHCELHFDLYAGVSQLKQEKIGRGHQILVSQLYVHIFMFGGNVEVFGYHIRQQYAQNVGAEKDV